MDLKILDLAELALALQLVHALIGLANALHHGDSCDVDKHLQNWDCPTLVKTLAIAKMARATPMGTSNSDMEQCQHVWSRRTHDRGSRLHA